MLARRTSRMLTDTTAPMVLVRMSMTAAGTPSQNVVYFVLGHVAVRTSHHVPRVTEIGDRRIVYVMIVVGQTKNVTSLMSNVVVITKIFESISPLATGERP